MVKDSITSLDHKKEYFCFFYKKDFMKLRMIMSMEMDFKSELKLKVAYTYVQFLAVVHLNFSVSYNNLGDFVLYSEPF